MLVGWEMVKSLEEAIAQLRRDPTRPVRATVAGLTVEVRRVPDVLATRSAADVFAVLGPWEGETTEEMLNFLRAARRQGGRRAVTEL